MLNKNEEHELDELLVIGCNILGKFFTIERDYLTIDQVGAQSWIIKRVHILLNKKYESLQKGVIGSGM